MNPFRKLNRRKSRTRAPGGRLVSLFLPLGAGVVVAALMINLGLTQFLVRGYLGEDGFAVPQGSLSGQLRSDDASGVVSLLKVEMGDAVYTRAIGSNGYFVGEEKTAISSGYPLYTRDGQVLYFLDDSLNMVTQGWDVLGSYDGLYLSDGVTYNADNTQADLDRVLLVQVDGGYQLAQKAVITSAMHGNTIPMNAVCAFGKTEIVYYSYLNNTLEGHSLRMAEGATITIGEDTYSYEDFLKRLGLWEEQPAKEPELPEPTSSPEPSEEPGPSVVPEPSTSPAPSAEPEPSPSQKPTPGQKPSPEPEPSTGPVPTSSPAPTPAPAEPAQPGAKPSQQPEGGDKEPKPPEDVVDQPAPPNASPDEEPEAPAEPERPGGNDDDPSYQEPTVSFGELQPWVYTLSSEAEISDPASRLRNGGVQLYVYQIVNGRETRILRQTATATGTVVLGQLPPANEYHVVAEYDYKDANGITRSKTIDLGRATTLGYDALEPIVFSIRDENVQIVTEEDRVQVFSNCLQGRDLVFPNISNGLVTEVESGTRPSGVKFDKAESYVNSLTLTATANTGGSAFAARATSQDTELKMSGRALQLLCSGYTLSHWETADQLKAGTQYTYTITMKDRYGVELELETNQESYSGHTCKTTPSVQIKVPDATNTVNSTQITVNWKNPDQAVIGADPRQDAVLPEGWKAALYLFESDDESREPLMLHAYRLNENGKHIDADGNVVEGTQADTHGYYLPIAVNEGDGISAVTQWVIKDLEPYTSYTAVVVCGSYDIEDGRAHVSEELESSQSFMTVSLRSRVSYTAEVDEITHNDARLKFRLNSTDAELIPLLSELTFSLENRASGRGIGSFTLRK
ncbi:MAG: hypothetical protein PUB51_03250, partial [Oscillospiraceae bacterium]|nr:hypothetical protein [Oscillospiraceae bacterium]